MAAGPAGTTGADPNVSVYCGVRVGAQNVDRSNILGVNGSFKFLVLARTAKVAGFGQGLHHRQRRAGNTWKVPDQRSDARVRAGTGLDE